MNAPLPAPFSNSYTLGLIKHWFPDVNLVDCYLHNTDPITQGSIVFVNDELFAHNADKCVDTLKDYDNLLLISQDSHLSQLLRNDGHRVVHEPFLLAIDDAISMRHLGEITFRDKFTDEYNFVCLNRRICEYRAKLLQELAQHNLMAQGYVTYHAMGKRAVYQFHHEDLRQDDLGHYTAARTGYERHNHLINSVWCSSNLRNFIYVSEKFTGHTMLSSETRYVNFVTEKSFIALFCKKMPMIFSPRPIISMLENEGFDCFADIIDQTYDSEDTWEKKIKLGIASNREVLASDMRHKRDEIDYRTQRNYEHLLTHWLDRKLDMLKHNIMSWLNS